MIAGAEPIPRALLFPLRVALFVGQISPGTEAPSLSGHQQAPHFRAPIAHFPHGLLQFRQHASAHGVHHLGVIELQHRDVAFII